VQEMRRSEPMTLYLFEGLNHGKDSRFFPLRRALMDGQPANEALQMYAEQVEVRFESFRDDLEVYAACIRQEVDVCR